MGLLKIDFAVVLGTLLIGGLLLCMAAPAPRFYNFHVKEKDYTGWCDNNSSSILTVNGLFPGPTITATKGDVVYVNVYNGGSYGITIHWHGVKQPRNPWYDGPENITQCPIQPGDSFTYKIILSDEEGTLWWHAHSDWSRATVHGAFIIYPREKMYPFGQPDEERLIVLGAWYKTDLKETSDSAAIDGENPKSSVAHTINGFTGLSDECSTGTNFSMPVQRGKTYLLRIVNAVMNEEQFFSIAYHSLQLVGMDGAYTILNNGTSGRLFITPGQTMDVLFTTDQEPGRYAITSAPYLDNNGENDKTTAVGSILYDGASTDSQLINDPDVPDMHDKEIALEFTRLLRSPKKVADKVPKEVSKRVFIAVSLNRITCSDGDGSCVPKDFSASLNNLSFVPPNNTNVLDAYLRDLSGHSGSKIQAFPECSHLFDFANVNAPFGTKPGMKVIMVDYNESVEIVFQGTGLFSAENHPMHLHGYSFYVVGTGEGNYDVKSDTENNYNLVDPPLLNTVAVPMKGWTAIRFYANNPGVWFMHCHLERHASWGMDTVLIVRDGPNKLDGILRRPVYMPPCSPKRLEKAGFNGSSDGKVANA